MASLHDMSAAVDHATSAAANADLTPLLGVAGALVAMGFGLWLFCVVVGVAIEVAKESATLVRGWIAAWAK